MRPCRLLPALLTLALAAPAAAEPPAIPAPERESVPNAGLVSRLRAVCLRPASFDPNAMRRPAITTVEPLSADDATAAPGAHAT